jgi:hypothetical protein
MAESSVHSSKMIDSDKFVPQVEDRKIRDDINRLPVAQERRVRFGYHQHLAKILPICCIGCLTDHRDHETRAAECKFGVT